MRSFKIVSTLLISLLSGVAMANPAPSRAKVIQAASNLYEVADQMSQFASQRGYPNTSNDLAMIMNDAGNVEQAARFSNDSAEAKTAFNQIIMTWFDVRQRTNTICRFYSVRNCYYIRNNVRAAINKLGGLLGQHQVKTPSTGNYDDAELRSIPVVVGETWGDDGLPESTPEPQTSEDPSTMPESGWNP